MRLKAAGNVLLGLILTASIAFILYRWFFPIAQYFLDDEWFVLPERAWYVTRWDWLKHLLFFNQTRNTYVGDFILYRPGLFLWMWVQDVLFRTDRFAEQICLMVVAGLSYLSFYRMIVRETGPALAVAAALFSFTCLPGYFFYVWPHISGYLLALSLYTLAVSFLVDDTMTLRKCLFTGVVFFFAETFHELVAVTLVLLIAAEFIFWRRKDKKTSNLLLASMAGALVAYGAMVIVAFLIFRPPAGLTPGEGEGIRFGLEYLQRVFEILLSVIFQIFDDLIPFPYINPMVNYIRWSAGGAIGIVLIYFFFRKSSPENRRRLFVVIAPVIALLVGLTLGRVALRGVVKSHYFPMFQFFMVMALALMLSVLFSKRKLYRLPIIFILLTSSLRAADLVGRENSAKSGEIAPVLRAVQEVREHLDSHPDVCYGGVFDSQARGKLNQTLNIVFQESACGWNGERKPNYFNVSPEGTVTEYIPTMPAPGRSLIHLLGLPNSSHELEKFLGNLTYNSNEAELGMRHDGEIKIQSTYEKVTARELEAHFFSSDRFPELYNIGLVLRNETSAMYFALVNNEFYLLIGNPSGQLLEVRHSPINVISKNVVLKMEDIGSACHIFLNGILIMQTSPCFQGPQLIQTFTFDNGTPGEKLLELTVNEI